ncbi:MAG: hypothetical protein N3H31_03160 [Candidatus Nezhaarchaeota archaeon]|nr:hypothetical protein [Candidatus Nezhaarchaeota archaeon]
MMPLWREGGAGGKTYCERCGVETRGSRFCLKCWREMTGGRTAWREGR